MVGHRPKLKKECSPFDKKCLEKLKTTAFFKPKKPKRPKGTPPTGPPAGVPPTAKETPSGRNVSYTVTYPGGETRLETAPRDTNISLREQIKMLRKKALERRAAEKNS